MSSRAIVPRRRNSVASRAGVQAMGVGATLRHLANMAHRRRRDIARGVIRAERATRRARDAIHRRNRNIHRRNRRNYVRITGNASGTTHTTTRMIVRKTPKDQKFIRKIFKTNPLKTKYINRFGFAFMGASAGSKTIWYSVCHNKFNNICKYMQERMVAPQQRVDQTAGEVASNVVIANMPEQYIYIGKCTFSYELYNPTNYIMTVYIYDLICKRDTPYGITYGAVGEDNSSAPENCMQKGAEANYPNNTSTGATWTVADPSYEHAGTYFNSLGMKPTDYHMFNTFWKVKGIKKIVLPPTTSHHHVVVFNPKIKVTNGSLFYPHQTWQNSAKNGLGGLTQATLFGFQGQVATENNVTSDSTSTIGTLPGKLLISCVRKCNIYNSTMTATRMVQENNLHTTWENPTIFTDLTEQTATAT